MNFKPRIYKKRLYIGNKRITSFIAKELKPFLIKFVLILVVSIMIITMVLGGLAMMLDQGDINIQTQQINLN